MLKKFYCIGMICLFSIAFWGIQAMNTSVSAERYLDVEDIKGHPETFVKIRTDVPLVRYAYLPFFDIYLDVTSLVPTEVYYPYFGAIARLARTNDVRVDYYYTDIFVKIPPQGSKDRNIDVSYLPYTSENPVYFQQGKVLYTYGLAPSVSDEYQRLSTDLTGGQKKAFMKAVASLYPQQIVLQGKDYYSTPTEEQKQSLSLPEATAIMNQSDQYLPITYSGIDLKYETLYLDKASLKKHYQFHNGFTIYRGVMYQIDTNGVIKQYIVDILGNGGSIYHFKLRLKRENTLTGPSVVSASREGFVDELLADGRANPSFTALKQALQPL